MFFNTQVQAFLLITRYFTKSQSYKAQKFFLWKMFSPTLLKRTQCGAFFKHNAYYCVKEKQFCCGQNNPFLTF